MECYFPSFEWWLNSETRIAICAEIVSRSLLCILQIGNIPLVVDFQDICEDRVSRLNGARLFSVKIKIRDSLEHVMRPAREKI